VLAELSSIQAADLVGSADLIEDAQDDGILRLEIPVQNADGVTQTLFMELPRSPAEAVLNVGGGR
jgi:hypothetical protein